MSRLVWPSGWHLDTPPALKPEGACVCKQARPALLRRPHERTLTLLLNYLIRVTARRLSLEDGQAMVEYALILGLISVVAIGAFTAMSGDVSRTYGAVQAALDTVLP
jgi:Flp pilus assembly pilin Flp